MSVDSKVAFDVYAIDEIGRRGEMREALAMALQAIRDGACGSELYMVAANLSFQLGDLDKASQLITSLLAVDWDHVGAWALFGRINRVRGDIIRADYGRSMAETIFPALKDMEIISAELPSAADGQSFEKEQLPGMEINFDTMTFAEICTRQGYYNKALKIYHDLLRKNPHDPELKRRIEDLNKRLRNDG